MNYFTTTSRFDNGGFILLTITLAIMIPFLAAVFIPIIHKIDPRTHIGWFVLGVPAVLFVALFRLVPFVAKGGTKSHTLEWLPSYGINFTTHLDGLSMIFGLLIRSEERRVGKECRT